MKTIHILFMILAVMGVSANSPTGDPPEKRCICIKVQKKAEREYKKMIRASVERPARSPFKKESPFRKWLLKGKNMFVRDNFSNPPTGRIGKVSYSHADIGKRKRGKCFRW